VKQDRALLCQYPDEECKYLAHTPTPLVERLACGFLARMGFRKSEAVGSDPDDEEPTPPLTWARLDLERGVIFVARSKTEKPRPLALPGVTRAELHASDSKESLPIRIHDLRALFCTVSIAQGRPDTWIRDRTAHKTLSMLDRYRRQARMFDELNLGPLAPLDIAIPELRPVGLT
jgi:hypothetical protein